MDKDNVLLSTQWRIRLRKNHHVFAHIQNLDLKKKRHESGSGRAGGGQKKVKYIMYIYENVVVKSITLYN
jgi:hypothetical protein